MKEAVKITDFTKHLYPSSISFSPDGKKLAFTVKSVSVEEDCYYYNIWVSSLPDKPEQKSFKNKQKTFCWDDETHILYLEKREDDSLGVPAYSTKVWSLNVETGEETLKMELPWSVSSLKKISEEQYAFLASTNRFEKNIQLLADDEKAEYAKEYLHNKGMKQVMELPMTENGTGIISGDRTSLFICDGNGEFRQITDPTWMVNHFEVGRGRVLFTAFPFTDIMKYTEGLYEYDPSKGEVETLVSDDTWSIDFAYYWKDTILCMGLEMDQYGVYEHPSFFIKKDKQWEKIFHYDRRVTDGLVTDSFDGSVTEQRIVDDVVYFTTTEGIYGPLCRYTKEKGVETILGLNYSVLDFDVCGKNIAYVAVRDMKLPEVYLSLNGTEIQLSDFNKELEQERILSIPETFIYKDRDGISLDGFVMKPVDYDPNKKYPAVLHVHGGPKMVFSSIYHHEMQFWAAQGFFVLFTNPRGSCGKGNDFAELRGRQGTAPFYDLMDFVDVCTEKYSAIDPERIAVCGGSYGGFMTNWIIGHTDRFKCAVSQRSISDERADYLLSDIGYWFVPDQHGGTAWDNQESLWDDSPLKYVPFVKTPTLFIHSDLDYRCPLVNGLEMFAGLKLHGVETKLCMFYGENHGLSRTGKPSNRICRMEQILGWFKSHLSTE